MSIHYVGVMKTSHRGPRYNKIKGLNFEIQVRTLCMHAWAAISHYLDYKAEWDIPIHLRKGLNALSGLFYVADEQYERLYDARQDSRESAETVKDTKAGTVTAINFDTLAAFLQKRYADRGHGDSTSISKLVRELVDSQYANLEEVEADLDATKEYLGVEDAKHKKSQNVSRTYFFNSVGAVRVSLGSANSKFDEAMKKNLSGT